jgi:hypothetical protein
VDNAGTSISRPATLPTGGPNSGGRGAQHGFPVWPGAALKAAQDAGGHQVTADTRGFDPDPAAFDRLAGFLRARLPALTTPAPQASYLV